MHVRITVLWYDPRCGTRPDKGKRSVKLTTGLLTKLPAGFKSVLLGSLKLTRRLGGGQGRSAPGTLTLRVSVAPGQTCQLKVAVVERKRHHDPHPFGELVQ